MKTKTQKVLATLMLISSLILVGCDNDDESEELENSDTNVLIRLSDITTVRGTDDLVVMQFPVDSVYEIIIQIKPHHGDIEFNDSNLPSQAISEVKLYRNSVAEENLLSQISGDSISPNGIITFGEINYNGAEQYIVTISIVDSKVAVDNSAYQISLIAVYSRDDNTGLPTNLLSEPLISDRLVIVTNFGLLAIIEDDNNKDNENDKTILAGSSKTIFSVDVQAIYESMDIERVVFTIAGAISLPQSLANASIYLNDKLIETNANSDITGTSIIFDDLTGLIVGEMTSELKLRLNTENIGFQKNGATEVGMTVTAVSLQNIQGVSSGKDASDVTLNGIKSRTIDIVPVLVTPSVTVNLSSSTTPQFTLTATSVDNTVAFSNSAASTLVNRITLSTIGTSSSTGSLTYKLTNINDPSDSVSVVVADGDDIVFDLSSMVDANQTISPNSSETYKVTIIGIVEGDTVSFNVPKKAVNYSVIGNVGAENLSSITEVALNGGMRNY